MSLGLSIFVNGNCSASCISFKVGDSGEIGDAGLESYDILRWLDIRDGDIEDGCELLWPFNPRRLSCSADVSEYDLPILRFDSSLRERLLGIRSPPRGEAMKLMGLWLFGFE